MRGRFHHSGGGGRGPGGWWIVTECEIELEVHEVYRPDLVGWRRSRVPTRPSGRPITTRPDWVCEILSQSNAKNGLVDKLRAYQRAQVPHYWIVDPDQEVLTIYRFGTQTYEVALTAGRDETVHAEPFEAVPMSVASSLATTRALECSFPKRSLDRCDHRVSFSTVTSRRNRSLSALPSASGRGR